MRRGASAAERCGSALWRNVLSVVRKSRNSSGGLYRCRRRSAHDRRPTNAVRFLMNTLLAHPIPSLIRAFPAKNSLGTLGSHCCLRVPAKPLSRDPKLPAWHNHSSHLLAPVQSCFSKLLAAGTLRIDTHPKSLPASSAPHRAHDTFPRRSSNVRGKLRPTIE
jgi:hypothetical protein